MTQPLRLAVAGCGAIAQLAHLPVLAKMRGVQLVALCDNEGARARALADRFEVPDVFTDLEELLEADSVDALIVATPNHLHEPHVLSALRAGVDVLCERPLALTSRGVERVLAAAQKSGRKVLVGNNHRFRSDVQGLSRFVSTGELGRVVGVRAGAYAPRPPQGWRQRRAEAGGGAFLEQGFNLLDLALWLSNFAQPVRVSAHMTRGRGANAVEETMLVGLELEGDLAVGLDVSWAYVGERERSWFEVLCSRGSARLAPLRVVKELNGRPVDVSPSGASARDSAFLQSYRSELAHFVAVLRGETPYEPPTDQVIVARVLEAIYKAADERKEIRL
ncbi:Gfo/Idh/MocA family protein [Roseisolibacter agri]|uniref:Oxidoreductase n=1 Tax=Roseisolibacter agri TaxID=2014610 RepID=A0AA37V385_9BACT|nr:Gfo/Idh/MocA family oxidoreductase [Roseisolibacter agri]GLC26322.1 oxidoreductase [Roseisolibacter agri]